MLPDDLHLLRCHMEATWGLRVPPLAPGDVELTDADGPAPWALYAARVGTDEVRVWRAVPTADRPHLVQRVVRAARDHASEPADDGVAWKVVFRPQIPLPAPDGRARRLGAADRPLLEAFEPGETEYWLAPHRAPLFGVVEGDRLLSIAHSSRRTPRACELGINTLPDARRRGFARSCVLAWAQAVTAEGLIPIYSADATNAPSLALARSCGYREFARAAQVTA